MTTFTRGIRLGGVVACAFALASAIEVRAAGPDPQNDLKQLSLADLGNITVTTASKAPEELSLTPAAVFVITQDDIQRSGATSLPEVLRLAPGVQVSRIDSDHWAVGVRGFANQFSQSLLVLIDGRSIYTPLFGGVYWSAQDVLLQDVDRIEVIRGPGGTIWGADAVNGVINIITKEARSTPGVLASAGVGSQDHGIAGFRYGGQGGGVDYRVYAKGFERGPGHHTDGQEFDDWRMAQGGFRADWGRARDSLVLQGDVYKGRDGQSVEFASFAPPSQITSYAPVDVSGGNLLARWRRTFGGGGDVEVQTYYDRTHILGPQVGETRNTFDVDFMHHPRAVRRQTLLWGVGARLSPSTVIQTVPSLDFSPRDQTGHVYSVFAQDDIDVVDGRLRVTVGSKVEHNNYTGVEIEPSARVVWRPTASQSIWGAVTRAVRTPSRLEEDFRLTDFLAAKPPTFLRINGSPDVVSERLIGYEAGYRRTLSPQFYVDVSVFHNDHDDLVSFGQGFAAVETSPSPVHLILGFPYANGITGTSTGFEVAPDWKPLREWQLKGWYSYVQIDLTNKAGNTDTNGVASYEGSSPRHQARVQSLLTLPGSWQFDQTVRYVSALPAQNVDAYVTFDLRLGWQFAPNLGVSVAGQNLGSAHHLEFGHAPQPAVGVERSVAATLTWAR